MTTQHHGLYIGPPWGLHQDPSSALSMVLFGKSWIRHCFTALH